MISESVFVTGPVTVTVTVRFWSGCALRSERRCQDRQETRCSSSTVTYGVSGVSVVAALAIVKPACASRGQVRRVAAERGRDARRRPACCSVRSAGSRCHLPPVTPIAAAPPIWMSTGLPATAARARLQLRGDVHGLAERPAGGRRCDEGQRGRHGGRAPASSSRGSTGRGCRRSSRARFRSRPARRTGRRRDRSVVRSRLASRRARRTKPAAEPCIAGGRAAPTCRRHRSRRPRPRGWRPMDRRRRAR